MDVSDSLEPGMQLAIRKPGKSGHKPASRQTADPRSVVQPGATHGPNATVVQVPPSRADRPTRDSRGGSQGNPMGLSPEMAAAKAGLDAANAAPKPAKTQGYSAPETRRSTNPRVGIAANRPSVLRKSGITMVGNPLDGPVSTAENKAARVAESVTFPTRPGKYGYGMTGTLKRTDGAPSITGDYSEGAVPSRYPMKDSPAPARETDMAKAKPAEAAKEARPAYSGDADKGRWPARPDSDGQMSLIPKNAVGKASKKNPAQPGERYAPGQPQEFDAAMPGQETLPEKHAPYSGKADAKRWPTRTDADGQMGLFPKNAAKGKDHGPGERYAPSAAEYDSQMPGQGELPYGQESGKDLVPVPRPPKSRETAQSAGPGPGGPYAMPSRNPVAIGGNSARALPVGSEPRRDGNGRPYGRHTGPIGDVPALTQEASSGAVGAPPRAPRAKTDPTTRPGRNPAYPGVNIEDSGEGSNSYNFHYDNSVNNSVTQTYNNYGTHNGNANTIGGGTVRGGNAGRGRGSVGGRDGHNGFDAWYRDSTGYHGLRQGLDHVTGKTAPGYGGGGPRAIEGAPSVGARVGGSRQETYPRLPYDRRRGPKELYAENGQWVEKQP